MFALSLTVFAEKHEAKPYWKDYMTKLEKDIKKTWKPPKMSETQRVVAYFSIGKKGELLDAKIKKSSGNKVADEAALVAIKSVAPFEPLPEEYEDEYVDIEFTFDYKVVGSAGGNYKPVSDKKPPLKGFYGAF